MFYIATVWVCFVSLVAHMLSQIFLYPCSAGIIFWLKLNSLWNHQVSFPDLVHGQISLPVSGSGLRLLHLGPVLALVVARSLPDQLLGFLCPWDSSMLAVSQGGRPGWAEWHRIFLPYWKKHTPQSRTLIYKRSMKDLLFSHLCCVLGVACKMNSGGINHSHKNLTDFCGKQLWPLPVILLFKALFTHAWFVSMCVPKKIDCFDVGLQRAAWTLWDHLASKYNLKHIESFFHPLCKKHFVQTEISQQVLHVMNICTDIHGWTLMTFDN